MKKWFIADTHFSHANIIRYTGRPFADIEEMNCVLISNWNACIGDEDLVFFLGDFGLGDVEHMKEICSRLKGIKVCIRGNHDATPARMYKIGFEVVLESAYIKIGRHHIELIHRPTNPPPEDHFQLHGHIHEKRPNTLVKNQLNLCVEVWDYRPVEEQTLISIFDKATKTEREGEDDDIL